MPFGAGHWWLILLVLVIVLVVWGPGKLPEVGSGMGRAIREFKSAASEVTQPDSGVGHRPAASPAIPPSPVAPAAVSVSPGQPAPGVPTTVAAATEGPPTEQAHSGTAPLAD